MKYLVVAYEKWLISERYLKYYEINLNVNPAAEEKGRSMTSALTHEFENKFDDFLPRDFLI